MNLVNARRVIAATGLCALACASSAAAATPFGCRASAARATLGSTPLVEPVVANRANQPCVTETGGATRVAVPSVGSDLVQLGPVTVFSYSSASAPTTTGAVAPGAAALASVRGVTIPTPGGSIVVAGPVEAHASYACMNDTAVGSSGSTLDVVYINGTKIALTAPGAQTTLSLGGGSFVSLNHKIQTPNSITEQILDVHLAGLADVVVGEASVSHSSSAPCAGTSGSGGSGGSTGSGATPPSVSPCPAGSTLDPSALVCEIVLPGGGVIVVSRPFAGPTGGTVLALGAARKRFKSACLYGVGPRYAIVGTNRADRINGTTKPERILGLGGNDRIAGQGGNDCIDGGAGNDRIWGGNGDDRVYGGSGNDRISVQNSDAFVDGGSGNDRIFLGNGNDRVYGGAGNDRIAVGRGNDYVNGGAGTDTISTGNGNDTVLGSDGNDVIYVGNGKDHVSGGSGADRIFGPGDVVYLNCGPGRDLAYTSVPAMHYARRHGCEGVRKIHPLHY